MAPRKDIINTDKSPAPIGPYNQAVRANGFVFISGQIPFNVDTQELVLSDIVSETHQVMKNLQAVLEEAGIGFEHILKTSIFLKDMGQFAQVNEVYGSYFDAQAPARETVQVAQLPKNVNVEISAIALDHK